MNMIIKKEAATLERTSANEGVQLQSLTLSEGTIRFEPDVTDYNVTVAEDVTKILVKGVTSDENSFYTVSGNTNLVKGKNEIVVTVTSGSSSCTFGPRVFCVFFFSSSSSTCFKRISCCVWASSHCFSCSFLRALRSFLSFL